MSLTKDEKESDDEGIYREDLFAPNKNHRR